MKTKHPKNNLKKLRIERGLTLIDLADIVGVTNPHISMLEKGKRGLSWNMLRRLANALDCHPMDITNAVEEKSEDLKVRGKAEKEILNTYRGLSESQRQLFSHMLKTFKSQKDKK